MTQETDKELLELAAKAAGFNLEFRKSGLVAIKGEASLGPSWNPLTDDGDALRLAVNLKIGIGCIVGRTDAVAYYFDDTNMIRIEEPYGDDQQAGVRRAIVRAAAKIGKAM